MKTLLAQNIDFNNLINKIPNLKPEFKPPAGQPLTVVGSIISIILPIIFVIAGLILFINLVSAGLQMMTSADNADGVKVAKAKMTHSLIGFVILFASYWIMQILQSILGIQVGF